MAQPDLQQELQASAPEPFLPIEQKLVGWSLGIGVVALIVLLVINSLFPIAP